MKLNFNKNSNRKRNRQRNIIYFNPPYNAAVKTNIGNQFLSLIDKHFPPNNRLHKIFNRNTIKLSYSCSPNIQTIISNHNKGPLKQQTDQPEAPKVCNCRPKSGCPLPGECRQHSVVYQATVTSGPTTKTYIGSTSTEVKLRLANHRQSFRNIAYRDATKLSQYIWELKEKSLEFDIKWSILSNAKPATLGSRTCNLCTTEKLEIMRSDQKTSLNSRTELGNKCKHRAKFKLRQLR